MIRRLLKLCLREAAYMGAAVAVFIGMAIAADNLTIKEPAAPSATVKSDDVGGVHYQGFKIYDGEPDSSTYLDVTPANALKVDGSAVTQPVSGSVSLGAPLPAGTNNIGDVDVLSLPPLPAGTNNIGDVDVLALPALPAGTNNIGDVDIASAIPAGNNNIGDVDVASSALPTGAATSANQSTEITSLQILDDIRLGDDGAFTPGTSAVVGMGCLEATDTMDAGDVGAAKCGADRELDVDVTSLPALPAGANNIGDVDVLTLPALPAGANNIGDVDVVSSALPTGASTLAEQQTQTTALQLIDNLPTTEDTASANGDSGSVVFARRTGTPANTSGADLDYEALQINAGRLWTSSTIDAALPAGTNNIGDVDVLTLPALPAGSNEIGRFRITDGTDLATVLNLAGEDPLAVAIVDGSGSQITSFGGGTQYAEDTAHASGDTATMAGVVQQTADAALSSDGDRSLLQVDGNGYLKVNIKAGAGSGGTASTDDGAFTLGATNVTPMGCIEATDSMDAGDVGGVKCGADRELDVDVTSLPALAAGTNNIGDVDVLTLPALPAGANNIGDVDVVSSALPTGASTLAEQQTQTTALQLIDNLPKTEDTASADGDTGTVLLGRRTASPANTSGADLDYEALQLNAGRLWTSSTIDAALPAGTNNIGDVDVLTLPALAAGTNNIGDVDVATIAAGNNNIGDVDVASSALPTGAATSANQSTEITALQIIDDIRLGDDGAFTAGTSAVVALGCIEATDTMDAGDVGAVKCGSDRELDIDVISLPALAAGTNNIGDVDVLTLPALPAGTNNIGDVDVATIAAGNNNIGDVDVATLPNVAQATAANLNAEMQGDAAHDAAVSGNPVLNGAEARSSNGTAVANGDATRLQADLVGKLTTNPYTIPDLIVRGCGNATTTSDTAVIAAAGAGVRNYITTITIINTSATATYVSVKDGSTVLLEIPAPANNGGAVLSLTVPIRTTANTAFNFASAAGVTTMRVCAVGYTAP